jgi:glycine/D-amino acid oxidase-like deaminating enzyme
VRRSWGAKRNCCNASSNIRPEFLSAAQLQSDHIAGTQAHGALRIPDAIAVHPLKLSFGVLRLARASGARVHSASPVLLLEQSRRDSCVEDT